MSESVSVIYTFDPNTAEVTLLLEKHGLNPIEIIPAFPALSLGEWAVTFNLQAGTGVSNPVFDETNGIVLGTLPSGLTPSNPQRLNDTQWQVTLTNAVSALAEVDYDINGTATEGSFFKARVVRDPAIILTPDPPPPSN